jgi:hypothetical protein
METTYFVVCYVIIYTNDVTSFLQQQNVQEKLCKLEAIIQKVDSDIRQREISLRKDKASTATAIKRAHLVSGISPQDTIMCQSYQQMIHEKERMEQEILNLKQEVQLLHIQKNSYVEQSDTNIVELNTIKMETEKSADLCSLVT